MSIRIAALLALCAAPLLAHANLLGVSFSGQVVDIDASTGAATVLATSGPSFNSLASGGGAYWSVNVFGAQLATIDPLTGVATLGPVVTGLPSAVSIRGLAYDDGALYGIQNTGGGIAPDDLVRIDTATGVATTIGATGLEGLQALAADANGTLFAWDVTAGLVTVNKSTGHAADLNAQSDGFDIQTLAFSPDGVLYGARDVLYTLDTGSGTASLVAAISGVAYADIRGMEFVSSVPEPGTWAMFGLGLAALSAVARGAGSAGRAGRRPAGSGPAR